MVIRHKILIVLFSLIFLSAPVYADPWNSIVHYAGRVAGDVVKGYFRPGIRFNEVDIIKKRMDILEYRYAKFDISGGKPNDYKEVGELIISLKNMTLALSTRVGNLEGKMQNLEQRIAVLEAKHRQVVHHKPAPQQSYYTPPAVSTAAPQTRNDKPLKTASNDTINCSTTTVVEELMNCYSPIAPIAPEKDSELEAAYQALSK
jgi:hypothetical protein